MIRIAAGLLLLLGACTESADEGAPWIALGDFTGELAGEQGPPPAVVAPPVDALRVVTWNLHYGTDVEGFAATLAGSSEIARADVLLLQELDAHPDEGSTRASRLANALGMTWIYIPAREEQAGTHGLAIVSRYPLEGARKRELPLIEQPFNTRNRIAIAAEVVVGDRRVTVVDVHLDVRINAVDRVRQLHPAIVGIAEDAILGGDFNTNPWVWVEGTIPLTGTEAIVGQEQAAVLDDYLGALGFGSAIGPEVATMRIPAFHIRADNLHARGHGIIAAGVEHVGGSDHWPVWADIALR